jgi:thioredoxin-like negative regulator of GroEL
MQEVLELIIDENPSDLQTRWELAKHYEHRERNFAAAERLCREAISQLETRVALGRGLDTATAMLSSFEHRLARIRAKLNRGGVRGDE